MLIQVIRLVFLLLWTLLGVGAFATPVVTVYFTERPPFALVEGQTGVLINMAKAVLAEAGLKARFIELPASRIVPLLQAGAPTSLYLDWPRRPEGVTWARQSLPLYQEQPLVAVLSPRMAMLVGPAPRLDALLSSSFTLGLRSDQSLGALDRRVRALGTLPMEVRGVDTLLKFLQAGRVDYTLVSEEEWQYWTQHGSLTAGLTLVRFPDTPGSLRCFLYAADFDPEWADRIDRAIESLGASGILTLPRP